MKNSIKLLALCLAMLSNTNYAMQEQATDGSPHVKKNRRYSRWSHELPDPSSNYETTHSGNGQQPHVSYSESCQTTPYFDWHEESSHNQTSSDVHPIDYVPYVPYDQNLYFKLENRKIQQEEAALCWKIITEYPEARKSHGNNFAHENNFHEKPLENARNSAALYLQFWTKNLKEQNQPKH